MTEQFMTADETDRYIDERIKRAMRPERGIIGRAWGLIVGALWLALIVLVILVFALAARVQYGLPIPLPESLVATAGVTFSTAAAPLPTARQAGVPQQPAPALVPFYRGTEAPEQPTGTPEPTQGEPYTVKANLGMSSPASNPGFSCGVEPGMDPNATCATAEPIDPEAAPADIYSVEDRVFQPAVLPTSSTADNPGFGPDVEPGSEPTPVQ